MQVTVPTLSTHVSYGMGLPTVNMPAPAIVLAQQQQHGVGFRPQHQKTLNNLSVLQIAIGISCVIIYIVLLSLRRWHDSYDDVYFDFTGAGIWCGVLYIVAGSLGVAAARQNRLGLIVSAMVMSILSSLFLWVVIGMAAQAIDSSVKNENCMRYSYTDYHTYWYPCFDYNFSGYKAADSILIILSFVEFIISIWCGVLCCKGSCKACCSSCCYGDNYGNQAQTIYYAQAQSAGQQIFFASQAGIAGGQAIAFSPGQPSYLGMHQQQQQQQVLFTYPAAPGADVAPPSYQPSVPETPGHPRNQMGNVATGMAAYGPPLEVTKDRMAEGC